MVLRTEELHLGDDAKFVFWASGDDFDRLESSLVTDSTVTDYSILVELGDRRLYRVTPTKEGKQAMTYPAATEYDLVFLEVSATHDGSQIRVRVPTREALWQYKEACDDKETPSDLIDRILKS